VWTLPQFRYLVSDCRKSSQRNGEETHQQAFSHTCTTNGQGDDDLAFIVGAWDRMDDGFRRTLIKAVRLHIAKTPKHSG
jgi:hypothetical protein